MNEKFDVAIIGADRCVRFFAAVEETREHCRLVERKGRSDALGRRYVIVPSGSVGIGDEVPAPLLTTGRKIGETNQ